jgi:lysyl-tRNA synthetase, class II
VSTASTYNFWLGSFFHNEKLPAFILLAGMVVTFLGLRANTRLIRKGVSWWPGNIHRGKVHVHHVVIGLPVMFVAGVLEFAIHPGSPWVESLALFFGGAAGAVFDEFALILHLRDVYWEREGRKSIVAVFLGTTFTLFMTIGMIPLGYSGDLSQGAIIELAAIGAMIGNLAIVIIAFLKGRLLIGWIGLFIPILAFWGAIRVGRPQSAWARWRYADKPAKMAKAELHSLRFQRRWGTRSERLINFVCGAANEADEAPLVWTPTPAMAPAAGGLPSGCAPGACAGDGEHDI